MVAGTTNSKLKERSSNVSNDTAKIMAKDWKYKEGTWDSHKFAVDKWDKYFAGWLDGQCKGGWEVLKISRDYNCILKSTWVVFRKQV